MALQAQSLFLYNYEVTELNSALDFRVVALETPRQATLELGTYSLTGLLEQIVLQLKAQANLFDFTATADRTVNGGTENRITIDTTSGFFELLFGSGPRFGTSCAPLIGFPATDQTGATTYTGTSTSGTTLIPDLIGYNYLRPEYFKKNFGNVNIAADGTKESIVWQLQEFWQVQFKYEPQTRLISEWEPLMNWLIQQNPLEFTPEITSPNDFFEGTLEKTSQDGRGLAHTWKEMLPRFPFLYDSGLLTFRKRVT